MHGFLCVDKPTGISSFAVVKRVRSVSAAPRVGHNGTLDPGASGLLICGVGNATRLLEFLPAEPKVYSFSIVFGSTTDTLDRDGAITESGGTIPAEAAIREVLPHFVGTITQEPPRYSALKISGTPAYKLARNQADFNLAPRQVTIQELTLEQYDAVSGIVSCVVRCSGGTYVRALARDIAHELGTCGYAGSIRRTAIGAFAVNNAIAFASIIAGSVMPLITPAEAFAAYPSFVLSATQIDMIAYGRDIDIGDSVDADGPVCLFSAEKQLVAIATRSVGGTFHPVKVFIEPCRQSVPKIL
jgi:tRNA pseudouridine55 synthase